MDILITGGNGFAGRHLISALRERGERVRALVSPLGDSSWLDKGGIGVFRGDVRVPDGLFAAMRGADVVFHLAAETNVWGRMRDSYAVNVSGTENVCRAALKAGVRRFIHLSTFTVYGMRVGRPVTEEDSLAPLNEPYSITKVESDRLVQRMARDERLPAVILRPGPLLGPGDSKNFGRLADRIRTGKGLVVGSGSNAVPLVYIADVVEALLLAMDSKHAIGEAYNIGNDMPLTQQEYLSAIAEDIGVAPPHLHVPYFSLYAAAYAAERISALSGYRIPPVVTRHGVKILGAENRISIAKARRDLGYTPKVSIRDGVRLTAAWYRQEAARTEKPTPTKN
jgi:nucleoside-diphosphate-sugar epimerase